MKNLITFLLGIIATVTLANDVELRFTENRVEGDLLFIDIDIKSSNFDFNLASHNIRAYYDHKAIELIDVTSQLPEGKYGKPNIEQMFTDGQNVDMGVLSFEDHMGFINMSVQLNDTKNGGADVTSEWQTIHTMTFKITNANVNANIVWATAHQTEAYATAFVELGEWLGDDQINTIEYIEYSNYEEAITEDKLSVTDLEIKIGPNPTSDYAVISQPYSEAQLSIIDMTGSVLSEMMLESGTQTINVDQLNSGSYIFLIRTAGQSHSKQIMITE